MPNALALSGPSPTLRFSALILSALILSAIIASFIAEIEIVARGTGKIVPVGSVRQIQSQIDGRVTDINIREGDVVQQGAMIVTLDQTDQKAEVAQLTDRFGRLQATSAKLATELATINAYDPADPAFLTSARARLNDTAMPPERRATTEALLMAELHNLAASITELDATIASANADADVSIARLEKNATLLALEQKLFDAATSLQAGGNISQSDFAKKTQAYEELRRERTVLQRDSTVKSARLKELAATRQSKLAAIRENWSTASENVDKERAELQSRLEVALRNLSYSHIVAPVSGKIEELKIKTIGGRITAGEALAKLVPVDETIEFEGKLPTEEAAFLEKGQPVYLKFDAYPAERYAIGHGIVRDISGDTISATDKTWAYVFRVSLASNALKTLRGDISIVSGMTATADIVTGKRRVISYLFEPIARSMMNGARER